MARSVPTELLRRPHRVVRPRDLRQQYVNPSGELDRLAEWGGVLKLAHGYYAIPPPSGLGQEGWKPEVEAAAVGVGVADYGVDQVALSVISAARIHGYVPRALAAAVVCVPVRRRPLKTSAGTVAFWHRPIANCETQIWRSELGLGRVTTIEQTILDVSRDPTRGGVSVETARTALIGLSGVVDWEKVHRLAEAQGQLPAYRRLRWFAHDLAPAAPRLSKARRPVSALGLRPVGDPDPRDFGVEP